MGLRTDDHHIDTIIEKANAVIGAYFNNFPGIGKTLGLTEDERDYILVGLALRFTDRQIISSLNEKRKQAGLQQTVLLNLLYYRKEYKELIDDIYVVTATRIGELFRFADKVHRIQVYNRLATGLEKAVIPAFDTGVIDENDIKLGNMLLKVMDRMDSEMGSKPLTGMLRKVNYLDDDKPTAGNISQKDAIDLIKQELDSRYKAQLPQAIEAKVNFTDYTLCANGEKMADVFVCWNSVVTDNNSGCQCPVQAGKLQECPKFLNKSLLDSKQWLFSARERRNTIEDIAYLVGCKEYDQEIRDRVAYFLKKHEVFFHPKEESKKEPVKENVEVIKDEQTVSSDKQST